MLHYNFPPYSVGETGFIGSPKRREIGHGRLARRGVEAVMPVWRSFRTIGNTRQTADIIKVENFPEGDGSRRFEPKINDESYCFAVLNRNKKSIGINMKDMLPGMFGGRIRSPESNPTSSPPANPLPEIAPWI